MKYKAIIFDMDGTIISTESIWEQASKQLLKKHGNLSEQDCMAILPQLKGASLHTTCAYVKKTFNPNATIEELMDEKKTFAFSRFKNQIQLIDGFDRFHKTATDMNLKSAIATNASQVELEEILTHLPLHSFFKGHMYTIDRVFKIPKPQPHIYLYAAQQLNISPSECIAIEDSTHGITAAKTAGMFCIGINTGKDHTALARADMIIEHYDEINLETLLR